MKKNNYSVKYINSEFGIFKNNTQISSIKKIGSPTSNCQLQSLTNFNGIKRLSDTHILHIFSETYKYNVKKLFLLEISDKVSLKRFLKFVNDNSTKFSVVQNNEVSISKNRTSNTLLIKYTI